MEWGRTMICIWYTNFLSSHYPSLQILLCDVLNTIVDNCTQISVIKILLVEALIDDINCLPYGQHKTLAQQYFHSRHNDAKEYLDTTLQWTKFSVEKEYYHGISP